MIVESLFNLSNILAVLSSVVCLILFGIVLSFCRVHSIQQSLKKKYKIPGPDPSIFRGGNFVDILKADSTHDKFLEWSKQYGKHYGFSVGRTLCFVSTDLEFLRKVFFENKDVFTERQHNLIKFEPMFSGIFFAPHHRWKVMRKILTPAFNFYGSKAPNSTAAVHRTITRFLNFLEQNLNPRRDNKSIKAATNIDIHDVMKAMSLNLVSEVALDLKECPVKPNNIHVERLDYLIEKFETGLVLVSAMFPFLLPILNFFANQFEFKNIFDDIFKDARAEVEAGLAYLQGQSDDNRLKAIYKDEKPEAILHRMIILVHEKQMTRKELMGNVSAILVAGFDTTSTTLTYCFWCLGKYPIIQEKVREEVKRLGVESPYLQQFLYETMRLYPAVLSFTKRQSNREITIDGWTLPDRINVIYNSLSINMDPEIWPEPNMFDPDRFKEGAEIHPCAFAPFGLGERRCLGYKLALSEMKNALASTLLKYRVILIAPEEIVIIRSANVLSKPKEKVYVDFELLPGINRQT